MLPSSTPHFSYPGAQLRCKMRQTIPPLDPMCLSLWFYHLGTLPLPDFFCHKQIVSSPPQQLPWQMPRECLFTLSITPSPRTALQPWACVCLGFCFPEVGQILKAWVCYFEKKTMQITWSIIWGFWKKKKPNDKEGLELSTQQGLMNSSWWGTYPTCRHTHSPQSPTPLRARVIQAGAQEQRGRKKEIQKVSTAGRPIP